MAKKGVVLTALWLMLSMGCRNTRFIGTENRADTNSDTADSASDSDSGSAPDGGPDTASETETDTDTDSDTGAACALSPPFLWESTEMLIFPPEGASSIKDPTVVWYDERLNGDNKWLVYATTVADPLSLTFFEVEDWAAVGQVEQTPITQNEAFSGYVPAPQLFYFQPHNLWYLIYQTPDPSYSTSEDPRDVGSWTAPRRFFTPGDYGLGGIDFWAICDETNCHIFFSDLEGRLYRAQTEKTQFPEGFGEPQLVMEDDQFALYDASNVYKIENRGEYLLLVSAILSGGRTFRSWTSDRLDGEWIPLADTAENPFASLGNTTGAEWSDFGISHGEMLRRNPDESMTIDPCNMQYLYSGLGADEEHPEDFYGLALLTDARPL